MSLHAFGLLSHHVVDFQDTSLVANGGCPSLQPIADVRAFAAAVTQAAAFTCVFVRQKSLQEKFGLNNDKVQLLR